MVNGTLHLVGLEAVRRDWPELARRLQRGMLERVFRDEPVAPFVRQVIAELHAGELDAELVIRKGLRKGAVERYTAATPPHVEAARKAGGRVGRVVRYVMTRGGPEPVLEDGELPAGHGDVDAHLPGAGTPTQPVAAGYMANAYVRMKHPDFDVLRGMLNDVGQTITVHAG